MGQTQLLLIVCGVIIVGIAIIFGTNMFGSKEISLTKNAIINDMSLIAVEAYRFKMRPTYLGGGGGAFNNFQIPIKFSETQNAIYSVQTANGQDLVLLGTSKSGYGTISCSFRDKGKLIQAPVLTGQFSSGE